MQINQSHEIGEVAAAGANTPMTVRGGKMPIWIMDTTQLSTNFALLATRAEQKVCVRIAGGCAGMTDADKAEMADYFANAFQGYRGMIWSGGTRQVTQDGRIDMMVTEIPAIVAAANPGALALGTAPRTGTFHLAGESRFELDGGGLRLNPAMAGVAVVQNGPDGLLGWDGDLDLYFTLMTRLREFAGFTAVGVVAWNGGGVTASEILRSARLGWPTIVVKGSGRKADEFAQRLEVADPTLLSELPHGHKLIVCDRSDPMTLRSALVEHGFVAADKVLAA